MSEAMAGTITFMSIVIPIFAYAIFDRYADMRENIDRFRLEAEEAEGLRVEAEELRDEIDRYQHLCAAAYQMAGTVDAPLRFLDALSDGANGDVWEADKLEELLPVGMDEFDFEALIKERDELKREPDSAPPTKGD